MQFAKMSCSSCEHSNSCPQLTRLFINYCGSRIDQHKKNVRAAEADCRSRRSFIVKHHSRGHLAAAQS